MAAELTSDQMVAIDELVRNFQEEQVEVLTNNAAAAHVVGDVQAHKALGLNYKLYMDLINEEAAKFAKEYRKQLNKGGCFIQGKWTPWLADRTKEDRDKIASIIQQGYLQGKATGTKQYTKEGKYGLYPKDTIAGNLQEYFNQRRSHASMVARTEIARIQVTGSLTRYKQQSVKKILWLTFEPCNICEQYNRRVYAIDDMPSEIPVHPHCRCAAAPVPDEVPPGPAPEQKIPPGFNDPEPLPYKAPGATGKPQTYKHDTATVTYRNENIGWDDYEELAFKKVITGDQLEALENYITGDYEEFNSWVRLGDKYAEIAAKDWKVQTGGIVDPDILRETFRKRYTKQRDLLDEVIDKHRMKEDLILYRSCGRKTAEALLKDKVYQADNYQSTTIDLLKGEWFGSRSDDGYKNILVMKHTKGSKGFYIGDQEAEVLLPRGTRYRLLQVRETTNTKYDREGTGGRNFDKLRYLIVEVTTP